MTAPLNVDTSVELHVTPEPDAQPLPELFFYTVRGLSLADAVKFPELADTQVEMVLAALRGNLEKAGCTPLGEPYLRIDVEQMGVRK